MSPGETDIIKYIERPPKMKFLFACLYWLNPGLFNRELAYVKLIYLFTCILAKIEFYCWIIYIEENLKPLLFTPGK
jgi:hypothetical protein